MKAGLDANCFKEFVDATITETVDASVEGIRIIHEHGVLVADEQGVILQEWRSCTGAAANEFVEAWIADQLAENRLVLVNTTGCSLTRNYLNQQGMPRKDAKIIPIMKEIGARFFITADLDHYSPKQKSLRGQRRLDFIEERRGPVCSWCEKKISLIISNFPWFVHRYVEYM